MQWNSCQRFYQVLTLLSLPDLDSLGVTKRIRNNDVNMKILHRNADSISGGSLSKLYKHELHVVSNQLHLPERMLSKSRIYDLYMILNCLVNESHHPNEVENDACQNSSDSHLISKSTPKILPPCERYVPY